MKTHLIIAILTLFAGTSVITQAVNAQTTSETKTNLYFVSVKTDTQKLIQFLTDLPKGGDLHIHESGATYAENMIRYAYNDNLCINRKTFYVFANAKCPATDLLNNAVKNTSFYNDVIDAWSMQHFTAGKESGHDHFFSAFSKYGDIVDRHRGEILAEIANRAASENESYLELMIAPDSGEAGDLGKKLGWNADFDKMRNKLLAAKFSKIVQDISSSIDKDETKMRSVLACGTSKPSSGCQVKIRYIYQVKREQDPEKVFAQLLAGFEAMQKDQSIVGINLVMPEDGVIAIRDYKLQMQMVGYLHDKYQNSHVSLHAGELNNSLVPATELKFHVHDAVTIAKANRIGHGVDIEYEDNYISLLQTMAKQHIMVEINLSSNDEILGITGKNHPLLLFMQYGVPVTLSTDDEGVSRSSLTKEYLRAVNDYKFDYFTLKQLARNSLEFSFLTGNNLWDDTTYQNVVSDCGSDVLGADNVSKQCKSFLDGNEKANMQWNLEKRFSIFENRYK